LWGEEAEKWDGMGVQLKKDAMVQARTGGRDADGVSFRDRRLWLGEQTQKDVRVQALTGGRDADGCEVQG